MQANSIPKELINIELDLHNEIKKNNSNELNVMYLRSFTDEKGVSIHFDSTFEKTQMLEAIKECMERDGNLQSLILNACLYFLKENEVNRQEFLTYMDE